LQPATKKNTAFEGDVLKGQTHAQTFVGVDHFRRSLKALRVGENFESDVAVYRQRILQVDIAAVQAKFGDLGIQVRARRGVGNFGHGDESISRCSAFFVGLEIHEESVLLRL